MYLTREDYEIASQNGISEETCAQRFYSYGWDKLTAIAKPVRKRVSDTWLQYKDLCAQHGISNDIFYGRIRIGWEPHTAATTPVLTKGQKREFVAKNRRAKLSPYVNVAEANGISRQTWYARVKLGWSEEEAATLPVRVYGKQK